jgi:lipopolysaccharide transport system permease protein
LQSGLLPLVNLLLFVYWVPLLLCLVGARYRDLFQLVPIVVQLIFLLSPILYQKTSLGKLSWIADFNPFYSYISSLRHALLQGEISMYQSGWLLFVNILGIWVALTLLERERPLLPFLM